MTATAVGIASVMPWGEAFSLDAGVTVFPREWLRMRMSVVMAVDDPHDVSFGITLGLNHWFL